MTAKYVFLPKGRNVYCYRRYVPEDLRHHYPNQKGSKRAVVTKSLETTDPKKATTLASQLTRQLDALWAYWRSNKNAQSPELMEAAKAKINDLGYDPETKTFFRGHRTLANHVEECLNEALDFIDDNTGWAGVDDLPPLERAVHDIYVEKVQPKVPTFSAATALYIKERGITDKVKLRTTNRESARFISVVGDWPITSLARSHINTYRDHLLNEENLKTTTVRRCFKTLSAIYHTAIRESDLPKGAAFQDINIPNYGQDSKERPPFTDAELLRVAKECVTKDDDIRWLIAILLDTGARLSEALGLRMSDVVLDAPVPFIKLEIHDDRGLKTTSSIRNLPLVGMSLWGCSRAKETGPKRRDYLFPRYMAKGLRKNNTGSATAGNWLKKRAPGKTSHSFRHSMNDRLRAIDCPKDIRDAICGWRTPGQGEGYGAGYSLQQLKGWLEKVAIDPAG